MKELVTIRSLSRGSIVLENNSADEGIPLAKLISKYEKEIRVKINKEVDCIYNFLSKEKKFIKHFNISSDYNFCWVGNIFEKSSLKTPRLFQLIQIYAILFYIKDENFKKVKIEINDKFLSQKLFDALKINNHSVSQPFFKSFFGYISKKISIFVRIFYIPIIGILSLVKFCWKRRKLFFVKSSLSLSKLHDRFLYFSFTSNFNNSKIFSTNFSNFWPGNLNIKSPHKKAIYLNWYAEKQSGLSPLQIHNLYFNSFSDKREFILMDSFITIKIIFRVLKYFCVGLLGVKLFYPKRLQKKFLNQNFLMLDILETEFLESLNGKYAILYLLEFFITEEAFKYLNKIDDSYPKGAFFLCENQSWEKALNFHWKQNYQTNITGVINNIFASLDLRHSFTPKGEYLKNNFDQIFPSNFAAHNILQFKNYERTFPQITVKAVEAKRYNYLLLESAQPLKINKSLPLKILVLGDYSQRINLELINTLRKSLKGINIQPIIYFRNHPLNPYNLESIFSDVFKSDDRNLQELIMEFDIVFSSLSSGVSIDINFLHKFPVALYSQNQPNLGPLDQNLNLNIVFSAGDLRRLIQKFFSSKINYNKKIMDDPSQFFYLDLNLPKWKALMRDI